MSNTKSFAQEAVDKCVSDAKKSLKMAEALADDHGLTFNFDVSYGIGGRYVGGAKASCAAVQGVKE